MMVHQNGVVLPFGDAFKRMTSASSCGALSSSHLCWRSVPFLKVSANILTLLIQASLEDKSESSPVWLPISSVPEIVPSGVTPSWQWFIPWCPRCDKNVASWNQNFSLFVFAERMDQWVCFFNACRMKKKKNQKGFCFFSDFLSGKPHPQNNFRSYSWIPLDPNNQNPLNQANFEFSMQNDTAGLRCGFENTWTKANLDLSNWDKAGPTCVADFLSDTRNWKSAGWLAAFLTLLLLISSSFQWSISKILNIVFGSISFEWPVNFGGFVYICEKR